MSNAVILDEAPAQPRESRASSQRAKRDLFLGMGLELVAWHLMPHGTRLGFVSVRFPAMHMTLRGCAVLRSSRGVPFVVPPARPARNENGRLKRHEDGKAVLEHIVTFDTMAIQCGLSDAILELIHRAHPGEIPRIPKGGES